MGRVLRTWVQPAFHGRSQSLGRFRLKPLGYTVKTGDAKGAYTQALLLGAETWVTLLENRWPKHWKGKFHRPVVRLLLALYGHADAGGFWEAHCEEKLLSIGWTRLAEEWQGVFWHKKTSSMMI